MIRLLLWIAAGSLALSGCQKRYEGEFPEDCSDGADNDRDGFFDCIDQGCATAPVCLGVSPGVGNPDTPVDPGNDDTPVNPVDDPDDTPDVDTDGPADPNAFIHAGLTEADVEFTITFDMDELGDALCGLTTVCDCSSTYAGTATFLEGVGTRGTFEGTWDLVGTDCAPTFADVVWHAAGGGLAHHTFHWSEDGSRVDQWIAHGYPEDVTPLNPPKDNLQWWMDRINAPYDASAGTLSHQEVQVGQADLIMITNTFNLDVTFD